MKRFFSLAATCALLACATLMGACGGVATPQTSLPLYSDTLMSVREIGLITGDNSPNMTRTKWQVGGTDLGIPIYDSDEKTMYLAFGDTFMESTQSGLWRSNVMAVTKDLDASDGIVIDSFLHNKVGLAKQFIPSRKVDMAEMTTIPTGGIYLNGSLYVFYMSVRHWGIPGEWEVNYGGVSKSSDKGVTWEAVGDLVWSDTATQNVSDLTGKNLKELAPRFAPNFMQNFPVIHGGYVYLFGIPGGRSGGVKLARVAVQSFESFAEYEYFVGRDASEQPVFVKGAEGLAQIAENDDTYIISPKAGELSVMYNGYLKKWMALYQIGNDLNYRISDTPWGRWSKPEKIVTSLEFPVLYCGFMHPEYTEQDGKAVYFIMSQWMPTYNSRVMRLELR